MTTDRPTPETTMLRIIDDNAYWLGLALAVGAALFLVMAIGAVGVIGAEGDPADRMYLAVIAVGVGGAAGAGLEARGMARALAATATATALVAVVALLAGEHHSPVTSVFEILGVNAMFVAFFLTAAWLFLRAARDERTD